MTGLFKGCAIALAATIGIAGAASAQDCPVKLGAILPVSGPMGQVGERISNTGAFAVKLFNEAGGVKGCPVEYVLRDTQGQSAIGVDAAKSLVDLEGVAALIGAVSSGVFAQPTRDEEENVYGYVAPVRARAFENNGAVQ